MRILKFQSGQTLVELLVAIGISAILLPALATAVVASREGRAQEAERLQASALLRQATEAVRSVREKGWTAFAVNGTYHPTLSGNAWTLTASSETIGNFTRQVVVADVQRNAGGAIVSSGGTVDGSTKKVTVTVSWTNPIVTSLSTDLYFQRYLGNAAWAQTTQSEFNAGTKVNTVATATGGGQVELAAGTTVNWATLSSAGSLDIAGNENAADVFVSGNYAYVADSTILRIINITNPAAPTLTGSYTAAGAISNIYVSGNYAYLATAANAGEFIVVNVTTPASPTTAATVDVGDNADANAVFVSGTTAYLGKVASGTAGINEFYVLNVATPTAPTISGSINLTGNVDAIHVNGNFAYLATAIGTAEMTVINVTTPATPTNAGVYNSAGTAVGNDIFAIGTTVYMVEANNTGGAEFFILNAATPASVSLVGSYEAGADLNGVYVSGTNAFLATAITNAQFRILNITTPSAPTVLSSFNHGSVTNKIFQVGNFAYLASTSNSQELLVITGAAIPYQASGTFESSSFDATASAAFNYITFTITEPASTDITFQIATNNDNATWNYVGPDGTASTSYSAPGTIRLNTTGRYFRYKATLTGPTTSTPVLSDISINYSP